MQGIFRFKISFSAVSVIYILLFWSASIYAVELQDNELISAEISVADEMDEYTFIANAGETIIIRVADTTANPSFVPLFTIVDPTGGQASSSGNSVAAFDFTVAITGAYTVVVRDSPASGAADTGSYDLYFARAPGANDDGVLENGRRHSGAIDLGDIDSYTFTASAGETVFLRAADTETCLLYTSPSPRDKRQSRMPSSA